MGGLLVFANAADHPLPRLSIILTRQTRGPFSGSHPIVGPSEEGREAGEKKKQIAERHTVRFRFWSQLLERAKARTKLHSTISPGQYHWLGTGAGRRGLSLNYVLWEHEAAAELYIDRGKDAVVENKAISDALAASRVEIDGAFGGPLEWERLDNRRASRIRASVNTGGWKDDEATWPAIQDETIDAMVRLEHALRPRIDNLKS